MRSSAIAVSGLRKAYRGQDRARRHRLRCRRGHGLLAARPERGGQDDDGEHPDHVDRRPTAARCSVAGHDVATDDQGGARRDRRDRPVRRGGRAADRPGEPAADGGPQARAATASGWSANCWSGSTWRSRRDKPASTYSGGMRRKLDLAMTLVGNPRIIFLDEPTTGLDPRSRRTMWGIVRELVADGTTIFLTTQYLDEADQLADRIAVLDQGRLVAEGTRRSSSAGSPAPTCGSASPTRPTSTRRPGSCPGATARRRGADPAGAQRRRLAVAARTADRLDENGSTPRSSPCTRRTWTTSSSP